MTCLVLVVSSNWDHDFLVSERMLLCTSGYLHMARDRGMRHEDAQGRERIQKPGATTLYLTIRTFRYGGPRTSDHVEDFCHLLEIHFQGRDAVGAVMVVDNGPDYNLPSPLGQHLWFQAWQKLKWACFSVVSYASSWS